MHRKTIVASVIGLCLLASVSAFGASGDKVTVKGMIITRTGETLVVRNAEGRVPVVLTDDTKTIDRKEDVWLGQGGNGRCCPDSGTQTGDQRNFR